MRKSCLLLLAVAALTISFVSATTAFFSQSITTGNVITSGNIHIRQFEQERERNSDGAYADTLTRFTHDQVMAPLVQVGDAQTETIAVGEHQFQMRDESARNYIDRIVTIKNVGANPAYVRTFIAVPTAGYPSTAPTDDNWLRWDANQSEGNLWYWGTKATDADGNVSATQWPSDSWHMINDVTIGGTQYDVYIATYSEKLAPGKTTEPCLLGFYLDGGLNYNGSQYFYTDSNGTKITLSPMTSLEILVATQATQATTFRDPWTALDTAFGVAASTNHPWENAGTAFISSQEELNDVLSAQSSLSGFTLRLASGSYVLPGLLPAGIRFVGHGEVILTCPEQLIASGVDFSHVIFANDVNFFGSGEFDQVEFNGKFTAVFDNPAYLVDCIFHSKPQYTVLDSAAGEDITYENCTVLP